MFSNKDPLVEPLLENLITMHNYMLAPSDCQSAYSSRCCRMRVEESSERKRLSGRASKRSANCSGIEMSERVSYFWESFLPATRNRHPWFLMETRAEFRADSRS